MSLMRRLLLGDLDLTDYPFSIGFDEDQGAPENVYDTLVSMLADGELMSSSRVTNREVVITVLVEGPTLADLAINEATLIAECEKQQNTLTIDPGDSYAVSSVFETFRVQARLLYDPSLEQSNFRRYELTIPASPYPRSADLVETPATEVVVTPTYTLIDDGAALSGTGFAWTNGTTPFGSIAASSGKIVMTDTVHAGSAEYRTFLRTASLNLTGKRFLAIDVAATVPWTIFRVIFWTVGGSTSAGVSARMDLGGGLTRLFVTIPAGTGVTAALYFEVKGVWSVGADTFSIDQVQTADSLPVLGTARQKALSIVPGGSVRTQGSIAVEHATNSLGKTIVYTHPSGTGYLPPLTPWRNSGTARTTDSNLLSGAYNAIATATDYRIPVSALPTGRVELWAWLRSSAATEFRLHWSVDSFMNSTLVSPAVARSVLLTLSASTWTLVNIGAATMPPADIGPSGYVRVAIQRDAGDAETVEVDEAYLFATDYGRLTVVDCATGAASAGGPSNRLWVDAPSLDRPQGGVYRGNAEDRSDAWHAGAKADVWQVHNFDPAGTNIFVATQNTIDAETSLTHYRRFFGHASE